MQYRLRLSLAAPKGHTDFSLHHRMSPFSCAWVFVDFCSLRAPRFPAGASADVLGSRHPKSVQRHPDLEGTIGHMLDGKNCLI